MKKILLSLAAVAALASCVEEKSLDPQQNATGKVTIKAVAADTKTTLGDDNSILWEDGDAISLIFSVDSYKEVAKFATELDESGNTALFNGELTDIDFDKADENINLVYPANVFESSEGKIIFTIPAEQDGTVDSGDNLSYALLTKTDIADGFATAQFSNALALLKVTVPEGVKTLKITANNYISGTGTFRFDDEGTLHKYSSDQSSANNTVFLNDEGGLDATKTYDLLIYPGEFSAITLDLTGTDGANYSKTLQNKTFEASNYYTLNVGNLFAWNTSAEIVASPLGGEEIISASTTADFDYEVKITNEDGNSTPDWISITPLAKSFHQDNIVLYIDANTTGTTRVAKVTVTYDGEKTKVFTVTQNSAFMDFVYTEDNPIKWEETFDVYPSEEEALAEMNKITNYTNTFTISLTDGEERSSGMYKVENIFKTDKYYSNNSGEVAGKGGVYYADYDSNTNELTIKTNNTEKSYNFVSSVVLTYDPVAKTFSASILKFNENGNSAVWKGSGVIANYTVGEYVEKQTSDITGTYSASGKYGMSAAYCSSGFSDTFTITANNDGKGQYKITGMFNVYGGGGGTYYANLSGNVLTVVASNSANDQNLGGSLPNDITLNYSAGTFTLSKAVQIASTATTYMDIFVAEDYTATKN